MPNNNPTSPQAPEIIFSELSEQSEEYVQSTISPIRDQSESPSLDQFGLDTMSPIRDQSESPTVSYPSATSSPATVPYGSPSVFGVLNTMSPVPNQDGSPTFFNELTDMSPVPNQDGSPTFFNELTDISPVSNQDGSPAILSEQGNQPTTLQFPSNPRPTRRNLLEQFNDAAGPENQHPNRSTKPNSGEQIARKKQKESKEEGGR